MKKLLTQLFTVGKSMSSLLKVTFVFFYCFNINSSQQADVFGALDDVPAVKVKQVFHEATRLATGCGLVFSFL